MVLPRPTARIRHAAKLEFSSKDRSSKPGAGQRQTPYQAYSLKIFQNPRIALGGRKTQILIAQMAINLQSFGSES